MKVTTKMIKAAQIAEFEHYHPGKKPTELCWNGTPVMVIHKMLEAALQSYKHTETLIHHCERCGRTIKVEHDKAVPTKIVDCGCPIKESEKK